MAGILPLGTIGVTGTVVVVAELPEPFWLTPGFVVVGADEVVGAEVDVGAVVDDGGVCICWMWLALTTQETPGFCTLE